MAMNQGLTPDDRVKLKTLDTLLSSNVPRAHMTVATLIVKHWNEEHNVFQSQLIVRAEHWRRRHIQLKRQWQRGEDGVYNDLMKLLELPGDIEPGVRPPKKNRIKRLTQPSLQSQAPSGEITDREVDGFLNMIANDGISDVFDPGNYVHENTVFRPPLILLDGKSIFFDDIWPMYRDGTIQRTWDPEDRSPVIAIAMDYVLLIIQKEKKWTWPIADRYLVRLPWGHPWKTTATGRPGWDASLRLLSKNGMIEKHRGQTWKLTSNALMEVSSQIASAWYAAIDTSTD